MFDQLNPYFNEMFSKFQFGFREGCNVEQSLTSMIERQRKGIGHHAGALLTDLCKAFDRVHDKLQLAKINAYGLTAFMMSYYKQKLMPMVKQQASVLFTLLVH